MTGAEGIDAMKRLKSAIPKASEGFLGIIPYRNRYISYKHNASYTGICGKTLRMPSDGGYLPFHGINAFGPVMPIPQSSQNVNVPYRRGRAR